MRHPEVVFQKLLYRPLDAVYLMSVVARNDDVGLESIVVFIELPDVEVVHVLDPVAKSSLGRPP